MLLYFVVLPPQRQTCLNLLGKNYKIRKKRTHIFIQNVTYSAKVGLLNLQHVSAEGDPQMLFVVSFADWSTTTWAWRPSQTTSTACTTTGSSSGSGWRGKGCHVALHFDRSVGVTALFLHNLLKGVSCVCVCVGGDRGLAKKELKELGEQISEMKVRDI